MERTVDEAIVRAKTVYEWVTGQPAPDASVEAPYARIPPEVDREEHVIRQAARLFEKVRELSSPPIANTPARSDMATGNNQAWTTPVLPMPVTVVRGQDDARYVFELAGVPRDRINVELQGATLRVSSDRPAVSVERGDQFVGTEVLRSRSERVVRLPMPVDPSHVTASFENGLLTVRVRTPALSDKTHKIEVR
jgi:HSP20 family molecular chaperone IbpA